MHSNRLTILLGRDETQILRGLQTLGFASAAEVLHCATVALLDAIPEAVLPRDTTESVEALQIRHVQDTTVEGDNSCSD
jgi:hypothetical protein